MKFSEEYNKETGIFIGDHLHFFDSPLAEKMTSIMKKEWVIADFGCGHCAYYTLYWRHRGFKVHGYEGNNKILELPYRNLFVIDLSKPVECFRKYDCVVCLEVGEHIPPLYEHNLINNICNHALSKTILSWAVEGQGGKGHINNRNNDYVIEKFEEKNFSYNKKESKLLRDNCTERFFKNTLMVFDRT